MKCNGHQLTYLSIKLIIKKDLSIKIKKRDYVKSKNQNISLYLYFFQFSNKAQKHIDDSLIKIILPKSLGCSLLTFQMFINFFKKSLSINKI